MEIQRVIVIVLDSVGIGEAPDAAAYGDVGSHTLGNIAQAVGGLPVEKAVKTIWPFYLALVGALLLITYFPALSLTLPGLFN